MTGRRWNRWILGLFLVCGCGRAGFGPDDGGTADADGGEPPADTEPVFLRASPDEFANLWVQQGQTIGFVSEVRRSDDGDLDGLSLHSNRGWAQASLSPSDGGNPRTLTLSVDASELNPGEHQADITILHPATNVVGTNVEVRLKVWQLDALHLGPVDDTCPHENAQGSLTSACDFTGADALLQAVASAPGGNVEILLYDNLGAPFLYDGCANVPGNTWLRAAPLVDPANVFIGCGPPPGEDDLHGVLVLTGDNVLVERLNLISQAGSWTSIMAWTVQDSQLDPTRGHLIQNITAMAIEPEYVGGNSIVQPLFIGGNTTVRNSHFYGYYEGGIKLNTANFTRLVGNTFVFYQELGSSLLDVRDSSGVVFANNVVLSPSRTTDRLIQASTSTTGLVVTGNAVEGFADLVTGQDPGEPTNFIQENLLGEVEVESPGTPRFLADSTQHASTTAAGEGTSLDGVDLTGRTDLLPGAYQLRSERNGPRRMEIHVGESSGGCGAATCDFQASEDNEVQMAAWSSWPGGTIRIHPASEPYAGNAIIGWQVDILGTGSVPTDVVLESREEDPWYRDRNLWNNHDGLLVVLQATNLPVRIENLTLLVDTEAQADDRAVMIDGTGDDAPATPHMLRRLRIESVNAGSGLDQALFLGGRVLVQDVLVHGDFESCIRFGPRMSESYDTPAAAGCRIVNLTCRLTGTLDHAPVSAFDVASVTDLQLFNLAVDLTEPAPLFRAQRKSSSDSAPIADNPPQDLVIQAASIRGVSADYDGFTDAEGNYTVDYDEVLPADPFFEDAADSHLAPGAAAIDSGVDPSTVDPALAPGTSVDGVDRTGREIDRGCYEQGN